VTRLTLIVPRALVGAVVLAGCSASRDGFVGADGGEDAAPACERADPTCPNDVPSYAKTVEPILNVNCVDCHHPMSTLAQTSLATYPSVHLVFGAALGQVSSCLMPPAGKPPLSDEERAALLAWLACGAPNN
jgi:hypothetical protein